MTRREFRVKKQLKANIHEYYYTRKEIPISNIHLPLETKSRLIKTKTSLLATKYMSPKRTQKQLRSGSFKKTRKLDYIGKI